MATSARRARLRKLREKLAQAQEPVVVRVKDFGPPPGSQERAEVIEAGSDATQAEIVAPDGAQEPQEVRWHRCSSCGSLVRCEGSR